MGGGMAGHCRPTHAGMQVSDSVGDSVGWAAYAAFGNELLTAGRAQATGRCELPLHYPALQHSPLSQQPISNVVEGGLQPARAPCIPDPLSTAMTMTMSMTMTMLCCAPACEAVRIQVRRNKKTSDLAAWPLGRWELDDGQSVRQSGRPGRTLLCSPNFPVDQPKRDKERRHGGHLDSNKFPP